MKSFFGKFIKYFLWLCLLVLLGAFLFGLFEFKGNLGKYIGYLNSIDISQLFSSGSLSQNIPSQTGSVLSGDFSGTVNSGMLEGEFLPEPDATIDESDFGFSGAIEATGKVVTGTSSTGTAHSGSVSAQALVDLVKSKEK